MRHCRSSVFIHSGTHTFEAWWLSTQTWWRRSERGGYGVIGRSKESLKRGAANPNFRSSIWEALLGLSPFHLFYLNSWPWVCLYAYQVKSEPGPPSSPLLEPLALDLAQYLRNNNLDELVDPTTSFPKFPNTDAIGIQNAALEVLSRRRSNILRLQLTYENANTLIPYIDLINEVLESSRQSRYTLQNVHTRFSGYDRRLQVYPLAFDLSINQLRRIEST
ncbi:hypothetical protein CLAIMM_14776 [Cladophialophora immunda]|nr:hypothetical protein CLAIMM_14776 [Cladophialophora immunda]